MSDNSIATVEVTKEVITVMSHINITEFVSTIGYIGVFFIIFAETGLFVGFFLPGDSLLFAAGLLASQHIFNIWLMVPIVIVMAILGYFVAYWFGEKLGGWLLKREDSFFFKKRYLYQASDFYKKHGGKALILGRLMPILRTFVPIVAGMAKMRYRNYVIYNFVGGFIWAGGVTLLGYYLGRSIPQAEKYILPIILLVIFISITPGIWHFLKNIRDTRKGSN